MTDLWVNRCTTYDLVEMIFIAFTATMCGAQRWGDNVRFAMAKFEWLERFIRLQKGVASHDTLPRVLARLAARQEPRPSAVNTTAIHRGVTGESGACQPPSSWAANMFTVLASPSRPQALEPEQVQKGMPLFEQCKS